MSAAENNAGLLRKLEAENLALASLLKSVLTTFIIRGIISRADIDPLFKTAEELLADGDGRTRAADVLHAIGADLPGYQRARMGPIQNDDDHQH